MKKVIFFLLCICISNTTISQNSIDWVNAPKNPVPLTYTLNHHQLIGDVKTSEEFGFNSILFTRDKYTFNQDGLLVLSVYVNKHDHLKNEYTTLLYNTDGTVASKTTKIGDVIDRIETFTYNKKKQLVKNIYKSIPYPQHNSTYIYEYDNKGWLKKYTNLKEKEELSRVEYDYDNLKRVHKISVFNKGKLSTTKEYSYKKISDLVLELSVITTYTNGNKVFNSVETYNNGFLVKDMSSVTTDYTLQFDSQQNLLESSFRNFGNNFGGKRYRNTYYNPAHNTVENLIDIGCISGDCVKGYGTLMFKENIMIGFFKDSQVDGFSVSIRNDDTNISILSIEKLKATKSILFSNNAMLQYVGFVDGKLTGNYFNSNNNGKITIGVAENNALIKKYTNSKNNIIKGCVSGNCVDGFGKLQVTENDSFEGFFNNSQPSEGILKMSSGHRYIGALKNGKKFQDLGVLMLPNGDKYMGFWDNGLRHGQGVYQYANGVEDAGVWENDELKTKM